MAAKKYEGTVKASSPYDAETDGRKLRGAMKGLGTNEAVIIETIAQRTAKERILLVKQYKTMYGADLNSEITGELGGQLKAIVLCLLMPPDEFDAAELQRAMKGYGTDEDTILEILLTRSNAQLLATKKRYQLMYNEKLETHLKSEASGEFATLLISLANAGRNETLAGNQAKAEADAQVLLKAGEKRWGTDEEMFNSMFAVQSFEQLSLLCDEYDKISKAGGIEKAIKGEMSGDMEHGFLTIVKCARNRPRYFAEKLHKTMAGAGTNEKSAIRLIVTRCEVEMVQIKEEFLELYGKSLGDYIRGDFSGDSKKMLLALIGET